MKYIMLKETVPTGSCFIPIIFPSFLVHIDVADAILRGQALARKPGRTITVDSAGEISLFDGDFHCHGSSETLGVESNPERDTYIIKMNDYGGGLMFE